MLGVFCETARFLKEKAANGTENGKHSENHLTSCPRRRLFTYLLTYLAKGIISGRQREFDADGRPTSQMHSYGTVCNLCIG